MVVIGDFDRSRFSRFLRQYCGRELQFKYSCTALPHPVLTVVEPVNGMVEANGTVSLMYVGTGSVGFELCTDHPSEFRVFDYWGNDLCDGTSCDMNYWLGHCGTYYYFQESATLYDGTSMIRKEPQRGTTVTIEHRLTWILVKALFLWTVTTEDSHGLGGLYELEAHAQ